MLVHRRVTPSIKFAGTHLYTWVERGTVRVKCLAQEHNTMSPARVRTRTVRSGVERTNHEATVPPTWIINNYSPKWRKISTTFTDTEVKISSIIYHTSWITSGLKSDFICANIPTKAILFFLGCSEVNSTWLITSELTNQRAWKVPLTCVVYTNDGY